MIETGTTQPDALRSRLVEYLREQCHRLTQHFASAIDDGDETAIHKSRVALRRLRSTLRQFAALVPDKRRRRAGRALRLLARALGPIRDLDALVARLATEPLAVLRDLPAPAEVPAAVDVLREALRAERAQHLAALAGAATPALLGRVLVRVTATATRCRAASSRSWLPRIAARFLEATEPLLATAQEPDAIECQHKVRIHVKRLRYAFELLDPLVPDGLAEDIALAQAAQEGLGAVHDLAVLAEHARRLVPQRPELAERLDAIRRGEHARLLAADHGLISGLCARLRARAALETVA